MKNIINRVGMFFVFGFILFSIDAFAFVPIESSPSEEPNEEEVVAPIVSFDTDNVIRVGYYPNYTEFVSDIDSLNNKGYGVDIFNKIQEISNFEFEYVPVEGDPTVALDNGDIDLLAFHTKSSEREEEYLFSQMQYGKAYVSLMTEDMDFLYADFDSIDGKTVATYEDNIGNERLDFLCENLGFTVEYIYGDANDYMDIEADFYLAFSSLEGVEALNNVLDVGVYSLFLVSNYDNRDMMERIDAVFYDIAVTEGNFFLELEEKYMASNVEFTHRGLLPSEIAILQQRPLEVGYIADYNPICFRNEQGEPDGAMVETLDYFAQRYGFEVNYHAYSLDDPPEEHQDYDILLSLYGEGGHDWEYYVTSEPYYDIPLYAQVNLDRLGTIEIEEILSQEISIGILPYQTLDLSPLLQQYPNIDFVYYHDWYELLDDFEAGKLDMLVCTESATTFAKLYLEDMHMVSLQLDVEVPMQYFINKEIADEYVPVFNVMIDRIEDREYEAILEENANDYLPNTQMGLLEYVAENWYYFVIMMVVIAACFVGIYAHGLIKKKMALLNAYNTDTLTGLMSFNKFIITLEELMLKAQPNEYEVISFDVDMFKTINTHFSTDRGTAIIVAISEALKKAFEDTSAVLCRRSADQFLIVRRVDDGGTMRQIYNNYIMPAIHENVSEKYNVSLSFGNMIVEDTTEKISAIIGQVDTARKHGKDTHKTTFITFDKDMRKQYEDKINITFRMEQALKDKEFFVEYQPKIDFRTLKVGGSEALVRWQPKLGDKIYPDSFIPIFEANGFISYLDLYVLDEVCQFIKGKCKSLNMSRISVNLSAHTVLSNNIVTRISDIVSLHGISPGKIELELTESAIETDTAKFLETVKRFKKLGFLISIDDFGAGVSSLNRLSAVEADVLKLDKAFFDIREQGSKSASVVADVITMANHLNMKVVAEGVETYAQALWLKEIGCDYAQGYYFEKPMSESDFLEILKTEKSYNIQL